ncbi:MAG: DEAD/DEAH box helicase [Bacillota bacterium]|jgi:ATP-dependent RNA helicase DeaD
MKTTKFEQMHLSSAIMNALNKKDYRCATSVQADTIPPLLNWQDIIAKAPTGTGKTLAFAIPIIEHIDLDDQRIQALILAPTRELAIQICCEIRSLVEYKRGIRILSIYGGQPIDVQIRALKRRPQIIVATPGRLLDHLNRRTIKLHGVRTAVLDEADRMVDMGFYKDVTQILDLVPHRKNLALLSATISQEVKTIAMNYQNEAVKVTIPEDKKNKPHIIQYSIKSSESEKTAAISLIMEKKGYKRAIIFCNTKDKVSWLTNSLRYKGYKVDCIHGDIRQSIRERVLNSFRKGRLNILVATDVASRGIDVDDVDAVFNYDIPYESEYYIHRIGRTGRAQKKGASYTFVANNKDKRCLQEIIKSTKSQISPLRLDKFSQPKQAQVAIL